ncbi:MAG TPA: flagellar basal body rod protein FlgC [Terriglobales bacterium]|nr:flagellar basal body rod protein FlgC [Terriglobales bacterium]
MSDMFSMLEISGSAMSAERQRAEVVAANLANANTTRTAEGGPYRRKEVVFASSGNSPFRLAFQRAKELLGLGHSAVRVERVVADPAAPLLRYEPGHPDANAQGFVAYPAINPIQEMVDLMGAVRSYQLNASAVSASKQMFQQAIDILRS